MEAKGIQTDKGARNRWIRAAKAALKDRKDILKRISTADEKEALESQIAEDEERLAN